MLSKQKLKIVAAIDTSPFSIAVLDEAAMYAKLFDADLKVIMVEDVNMINAAKSPLVRSVNMFSFSSGKVSANEIQDIYALQRKTANKTVKFAKEKHNINIDLEIKHGKVIDEVLNAAAGADALMIGLAGWRFAKYYYSTHMIEKQSRYKFPDASNINIGHTAKKLLEKYQGTILALRGSVLKKSKIMVYYDGSKESKRALINSLDYLSHLKFKTKPNLAILLDSKKLRNEAFLAISGKVKEITPSFYTLKEGETEATLKFIEKLIDNTKSNMLVLPGTCHFIQDKTFYEELDTIHSSLIIVR